MRNKSNFFNKLIKYQETDSRTNDENFSTEILCYILNKLSHDEFLTFLEDVLFCGGSPSLDFHRWVENKEFKDIIWKTQVGISTNNTIKFPDLVCFENSTPIILIEVKINACLSESEVIDSENQRIMLNQLSVYGNWLVHKNADGLLILLTNTTQAPNNFFDGAANYGVLARNAAYWQQVYNWLKKYETLRNRVCIINDFLHFMEVKNMANESPTHFDFSAAEIFASESGKRISATMLDVRTKLSNKYLNGVNWSLEKIYLNDYQYTFDYDQACLWSWGILTTDEYCYIGWGICFPKEDDPWLWNQKFFRSPKNSPYAFVCIATEGKNIIEKFKENEEQRPAEWMWNDKPYSGAETPGLGVITKPIHEFFKENANFNDAFLEWVDACFNSALNYTLSLSK